MRNVILSVITTILFCGTTIVNAQNIGEKPVKLKPSESVIQVTRIRLAYLNAKYGRQTKSAEPLILAARILKTTPTDKLRMKGDSSNAIPNQFSFEAILADAKKFAGKNQVLLKQIEAVEKMTPPIRGSIGGPKRALSRVNSNSTNSIPLSFRGGEEAIIILSGNGKSDLDLYVYDENETLVDSDKDRFDDCSVRFYPRTSGKFLVKIQNNGAVANSYVLTTN